MNHRRNAGPLVRSVIQTRRRLSWHEALFLVAAMNAVAVGCAALLVTLTDPSRFHTYGDGLWWAVATITTVGYGDIVPNSGAGRAVGAVLMFLGIASFAILTAVAASTIVVREVDEEERRIRVQERRIQETERVVLSRIDHLERRLADSASREEPEKAGRGD